MTKIKNSVDRLNTIKNVAKDTIGDVGVQKKTYVGVFLSEEPGMKLEGTGGSESTEKIPESIPGGRRERGYLPRDGTLLACRLLSANTTC